MTCCGNEPEEKVVDMSKRIPAFYEHKNVGKHQVVGLGTNPRVKYGYFGGGRPVPNGVHPEDIRARPDLFSCGNCRGEFTITANSVYCPNCSVDQTRALAQGRPITNKPKAKARAEKLEPLPPPPVLAEIPEPEAPISLFDIEFGGKRHSYYQNILAEENILTLGEAKKLGLEGLIDIPGIGKKTANDILEGKIRSD